MFQAAAANNDYLTISTATALPSVTVAGVGSSWHKLRVTLDLTILGSSDTTKDVLLVGTSGGWGATLGKLNTPCADGTYATTFASIRNAVTKTAIHGAAGSGLVLERRAVVELVDDRSKVSVYVNGVLGATQASWAMAQVNPYTITTASPFYLFQNANQDAALYARLYEFAVEVNETLVCHVRPKRLQSGATTLTDLSGHGNGLVVAGTENTDWYLRSGWREERSFSGKETLS